MIRVLEKINASTEAWLERQSFHNRALRRKKILELLLWIIGITAVIVYLFLLMNSNLLVYSSEAVQIRFIWAVRTTIVSTVLLLVFNRYTDSMWPASLTVFLLIAISVFSDSPEQVTNGRGLFVFVLPIVISSVLLFPWASVIVAALSSLGIGIIARMAGMPPNVVAMVGFFFLAILIWLLIAILEYSLLHLVESSLALKTSQARLLAFSEALPDLAFIYDKEGIYVEVLSPSGDLLVHDAAELKGRNVYDVLPEDVAEKTLNKIELTLEKNELQIFEYSLDLPVGKRFFEARTSPMRPFADDVEEVVMLVRDITERVRSEEAVRVILEEKVQRRTLELQKSTRLLEESKERYRKLAETIPDAVFRINKEAVVTDYKAGVDFHSHSFLSPEDMIGKNLKNLMPADVAQIILPFIAATFEIKQERHLEFVMAIKGEDHNFEARFIPDGNQEIQVIVRNIDARVKRDQELDALLRMSQAVSSTVDLESTLKLVSEQLCQASGLKSSAIYYWNQGTDLVEKWFGCFDGTKMYLEPQDEKCRLDDFPYKKTALQARLPAQFLAVDTETDTAIVAYMREKRSEFLLVLPLISGKDSIGWIELYTEKEMEKFTPGEIRLLQGLTDQAAVAIENARLYKQAGETAAIQERARLARELHDSVTQSLFSLTFFVEAVKRNINTGKMEKVSDYLDEVTTTSYKALREMRLLLYELHELPTEKKTISEALRTRLNAVERRAGIQVKEEFDASIKLKADIEVEIYRIAVEALNNLLKHTRADEVTIRLYEDGRQVILEIVDNGQGFDPETASQSGGMGIQNMQERAKKIGAKFTLQSEPGRGSTVRVEVDR